MDKEQLLKIINELSAVTEKRITRAIAILEKSVRNLETELLNAVLQNFVTLLNFTDGVLDNSAENLSKISKLDRVLALFRQNFINPLMKDFAAELLEIAALNATYYEQLGFDENLIKSIAKNNDLIKARIGLSGAKNTVVHGSYIDSLAQTPEVAQRLKLLVLSQLSSRQSSAALTKALANFIKGNADIDGAMVRYYRQYAYDTYNQIHEIKNREFAEGLGLEWFIYVGFVIPTTRKFCANKAGKVFSTKEAMKWKDDPDLIEPKTKSSYQPLIERGRYNCRHMMKYLSKDMAKAIAPEKFKA